MKKNRAIICIIIGLLFLTAALCLTVYNICDGFRAQQSSSRAVEYLKEQVPTENTAEPTPNGENEIPDYILNPNMDMPEQDFDETEYIGILTIPSLGLELPVISSWSYPSLKIAPCRYSGSAYLDNLAIAAHNYRSHFGMLKNLSEGDEIYFTDMDSNRFDYEVALVEVLAPTDVEEIVDSEFALSLFTCNFSGQARVTVRCDRIERSNR